MQFWGRTFVIIMAVCVKKNFPPYEKGVSMSGEFPITLYMFPDELGEV